MLTSLNEEQYLENKFRLQGTMFGDYILAKATCYVQAKDSEGPLNLGEDEFVVANNKRYVALVIEDGRGFFYSASYRTMFSKDAKNINGLNEIHQVSQVTKTYMLCEPA